MEQYRTPIRRPTRITKSLERGEKLQSWTASRCHRLLRPLISRIAALRKDLTQLPTQTKDTVTSRDQSRGKRQAPECEWLVSRKKVRHTYAPKIGSRRDDEPLSDVLRRGTFKPAKQLQQTGFEAPGEIVPSTPWLRRARGQQSSPPVLEPEHVEPVKPSGRGRPPGGSSRSGLPAAMEQRLSSLRSTLSSARYSDYEGIFRGLEALLRATQRGEAPKKGPRSFLDMCLRRMPGYISELEAWDALEAEENHTQSVIDDSNTSFQMYSELETLGTASGWKHLGTVVRTHGLDAVKGAVSEGLFSDEFAILLLDLCVHCGASNEIDELMSTFINRQYPLPSNTNTSLAEDVALLPLIYLQDFHHRAGRPSFLLRQLTVLLLNGFLPKEWLATKEFERFWGMAHQALSKGSNATDPVHFLTTSISLLCQTPISSGGIESRNLDNGIVSAIQQTLMSSLAIMSGMSLLGKDEIQRSNSSSMPNIAIIEKIGHRIDYALQACIAEVAFSRRSCDKVGKDLLGLATYFASRSNGDGRIMAGVLEIIETTHSNSERNRSSLASQNLQRYDAMISMIAAISRICGRGTSQASHDYLERLCRSLGMLNIAEVALRRMSRAAAFALAQRTNSVRDLIYAESLAFDSVDARNDSHDSEQSPALFKGYRWEETIGEWVTVSPLAEKKPFTRQLLVSSSAGVDDCRLLAELSPTSSDAPARPLTRITSSAASVTGSVPDIVPSIGRVFCSTNVAGNAVIANSPAYLRRDSIVVVGNSMGITKHKFEQRDELCSEKENLYVAPGKTQLHGTKRIPHGLRRRARLSGDHHSDDELGI